MSLAWNRYGKANVRLVKVRRGADVDDIVDLTIDVQLEGDFDAVYCDGDNRQCLPTDTMKNTVYVFARQDPILHVETFAERLATHFAGRAAVSRARISAVEHRWERVKADGRSYPHVFARDGAERWTAVVSADVSGTEIASGLVDLVVLKTADSAFTGFSRDPYTTLPETEDRMLATSITATWRYRRGMQDFSVRGRIREALVTTFATHKSRSVQHTLYAMAEAALAECADVEEITLSLPNRHHLLVNLESFGLDNPNEVFVASDQPYGLIEATVRR
jgi:urate oxidase